MFKYYCKKHDCTWVAYPGGKWEAIGTGNRKVNYEFELATGKLMVKIINALATEKGNRNTIATNVIKDFVKELYGRKSV